MARVATYVPYSELNRGVPSTLTEFREELRAFSRTSVLHLCSVMNAMLRSDDDPINERAHRALVKSFFSPDIAVQLLRQDGDVRFAFHRQQILFVAKTAITHCADVGLIAEATQFRRLGRIFLMASDHLPAFAAKPEPLDDKFAYVAAQLLPVQEGSGFHRFDHKIARSYTMLSESASKLQQGGGPNYDIASQFEQATQLPLLTFQSLILAALTKFYKFDPYTHAQDPRTYRLDERWFASTQIRPEVVGRFPRLGFCNARAV